MTYYVVVTVIVCAFLREFLSIPEKYLKPDEKPKVEDLELYLDKLDRITSYQCMDMNTTDTNQRLSAFFVSALLLRTLDDYKHGLGIYADWVKELFLRTDNFLSYMTLHNSETSEVLGLRNVNYILARTMKNFNIKWLPQVVLMNESMSEYTPQLDDGTLPKEIYANLSLQYFNQKISITATDSNKCLTSLSWNIIPKTPNMKLHRCKARPLCYTKIFQKPSVAYNLNHRQLNAMVYNLGYRCYLRSRKEDLDNTLRLCAAMYREAVYIARRGFFAIDLFAEHIAFCSFYGFEEFHRRHWFRKLTKHIDEDGCISETHNFLKNCSMAKMKTLNLTPEQARRRSAKNALRLEDNCQPHEMAVTAIALAAAIRHAAHHITSTF